MYSRKFSSVADLPAGYSGVAMRRDVPTSADAEASSSRQEIREQQKEELGARRREREEGQRTLCRPRRPLYKNTSRDACSSRQRGREENSFRERQETSPREEKNSGLLSSLFSLAGKSFSMEDIVLAGLLLLLLSDKDKGGKTDNDILLILGLLLMSGK